MLSSHSISSQCGLLLCLRWQSLVTVNWSFESSEVGKMADWGKSEILAYNPRINTRTKHLYFSLLMNFEYFLMLGQGPAPKGHSERKVSTYRWNHGFLEISTSITNSFIYIKIFICTFANFLTPLFWFQRKSKHILLNSFVFTSSCICIYIHISSQIHARTCVFGFKILHRSKYSFLLSYIYSCRKNVPHQHADRCAKVHRTLRYTIWQSLTLIHIYCTYQFMYVQNCIQKQIYVFFCKTTHPFFTLKLSLYTTKHVDIYNSTFISV